MATKKAEPPRPILRRKPIPRFSAKYRRKCFRAFHRAAVICEAMRGAVWRPVWRSGATSIEGDHGEKRQFKLIHHQVSDWPEARAAWMAGHRAGRTPVFRRGMNGTKGWALTLDGKRRLN
jgi:hypothetical protein